MTIFGKIADNNGVETESVDQVKHAVGRRVEILRELLDEFCD